MREVICGLCGAQGCPACGGYGYRLSDLPAPASEARGGCAAHRGDPDVLYCAACREVPE